MTAGKVKSSKGVKPNRESGDSRSDDSQRRTVSVEEAGRILGISRGAAYAHANDGTIPIIRVGKRLLVPKAALERLLNGEQVA
jgi:excisionase family DNA binding protein